MHHQNGSNLDCQYRYEALAEDIETGLPKFCQDGQCKTECAYIALEDDY